MRFIFYAAFLFLSSCSVGTDSGNPGFKPGDNTSASRSNLIATQVCAKLTSCRGADVGVCEGALLTAGGVSSALGLNTSDYPTLASALTGVDKAELFVDPIKMTECQTAIDTLACTDPLVHAAFTSTQPQAFDSAHKLLSVSRACQSFIAP